MTMKTKAPSVQEQIDLAISHNAWDALCEARYPGNRAEGERLTREDLADGTVLSVPEKDRRTAVVPYTLFYSDMESFTIAWFPSLGEWVDWDDAHTRGLVK